MALFSWATSWRGYLLLSMSPGFLVLLAYIWVAGHDSSDGRNFTLFDDAMISMTYARTLAESGELVWYPGAPRVQGFTNPLWTLWMSVIHTVGFEGSQAALVISISGAVLVLLSAFLVAQILKRVLSDHEYGTLLAAVAGGSVALLAPLSFWALRGMEVGLLALMATILVWGAAGLLCRPGPGRHRYLVSMSLACCIGTLTRLDFAIIGGVVGLWALSRRNEPLLRPYIGLTTLAVTFGSALAVLAIQWKYYGDPLPNTYYLKATGYPILLRLEAGALVNRRLLAILLMLAWAWHLVRKSGLTWKPAKAVLSLVISTVLAVILYSVWVGGDAWEWSGMSRYFAVVAPLTLVGVAIGACAFATGPQLNQKQRLINLGLLALAVVATYFFMIPPEWSPQGPLLLGMIAVVTFWFIATLRSVGRLTGVLAVMPLILFVVVLDLRPVQLAFKYHEPGIHVADDARMTELGTQLRELTTPDASIGVIWAGAPGYYSERQLVDLLGKSDPTIARSEPRLDGRSLPSERESSPLSNFHPGHNKWNYHYSIGHLSPDVVMGLFRPMPQDLENLSRWGYETYCLDQTALLVKVTSLNVDREQLREC